MLQTLKNSTIRKSPWRYLGRIRSGKTETRQGQNGAYEKPVNLDHFAVPEKFKKVLGEQPRTLSIVLMHPTLEQNFDTMAAIWRQGGKKYCWTSDDVKAKRYDLINPNDDPQRGARRWVDIDCPNTQCQYRIGGACQPSGIFRFGIPLASAQGEYGEFDMAIRSKVGIDNIYQTLNWLEEVTRGREQGMRSIRMTLAKEQREFSVDLKKDGHESAVKVWIVTLTVDAEGLLPDDRRMLLSLPAPEPVAISDVSDEAAVVGGVE